jgi:hypothetical protein
MNIKIIIFFISLLVYIPLSGVLLYVWHKYGKFEAKVFLARIIFLIGSVCIIGYMLSL